MREPIAPYDCNHENRLFITAMKQTPAEDGLNEYDVHLCPDCGTFLIFALHRFEAVEVTFTLPTAELVKAAGRYYERLTGQRTTAGPAVSGYAVEDYLDEATGGWFGEWLDSD